MGKRKSAGRAVDREKNWGKIFNALVTLTKNLEKERRFLEDKIKLLNGVVCKMKMEQKVESAKNKFLLGLKDAKASVYKDRCVSADREMEDVQELLDYFSERCSAPPNASDVVSSKEGCSEKKVLENEVRKLKDEIEKCQSAKNLEISALLSEKNFLWNQYNKMEGDLSKLLRKKDLEVEQANEKLSVLMGRVEELQFANERLRIDHARIQSESDQKCKEISGLLKEIERFKTRSESSSPLLRACLGKSAVSRERANKSIAARSLIEVKKEVGLLMTHTGRSTRNSNRGKALTIQPNAKDGSSSSKRKAVECITIADDDSPKLFTSSFKVPKLKFSSSPHVA